MNMNVGDVSYIDFQDGLHLCYCKLHTVCPYLSSEERHSHDFGAYTYVFRVTESIEMYNMDMSHVRYIFFIDDGHLCYHKLYKSISQPRGEIKT